jgi:signal transduction histidine kinase
MTLKNRIAIFISILFTVLFGIVSIIIVSLFAEFRQQEFRQRLEEKALSTVKLLLEVKEVDYQLLKVIDRNSINELYDEKTLIFDSTYHLIYSSLDDTRINWTKTDLEYLKKHKTFFKRDGDNEIYGVFYDTKSKDYFALISANDSSGKRKLEYLMYLVTAAYLLFTLLAWLLTFYTVKRLLVPLEALHQNISGIQENNLATRLPVISTDSKEISLLASEFNQMMDRIENAYQSQKDFTAQASHELRTPLARLTALLENKLQGATDEDKSFLQIMLGNINQLNELISSLLIISKAELHSQSLNEQARIDEVVYTAIERMHNEHKDFRVNFDLVQSDNLMDLLNVPGNAQLLEIVFINLLRNAYYYSDNKEVDILVQQTDNVLEVYMRNTGTPLTEKEQDKIFQPFSRGANSKGKQGVGLGLRIVHRILSIYGYSITYSVVEGNNQFKITFNI